MKLEKSKYLIAIFSLLATLPQAAYPATYNIYFNSSEQGNNSTATPTVIVNDPEHPQQQQNAQKNDEVKPASTAPATQVTPPPASTFDAKDREPSAAPATDSVTTHGVSSGMTDSGFSDHRRRFRVMAGGAYNAITAQESAGVFNSDPNSTLPFWEQKHDNSSEALNPTLEATWFFHRNWGLTAVLGDISGLEMTALPIGNDKISFIQPEFALGILAASSNVSIASGPTVGMKVAFNFTPMVSLVVGGRTTIAHSSDFSFYQGTAGLAFNF